HEGNCVWSVGHTVQTYRLAAGAPLGRPSNCPIGGRSVKNQIGKAQHVLAWTFWSAATGRRFFGFLGETRPTRIQKRCRATALQNPKARRERLEDGGGATCSGATCNRRNDPTKWARDQSIRQALRAFRHIFRAVTRPKCTESRAAQEAPPVELQDTCREPGLAN